MDDSDFCPDFDHDDNMEERVDEIEEEGETGGEEVEEVAEEEEQSHFQRKKRKKTSKVWGDVNKVTINGVLKAECKYCKKCYVINKDVTTRHIKRHLDSCPRNIAALRGQTRLNLQPKQSEVEAPVLYSGKYDHARQREAVAHWILTTQKPFSVVDDPAFTFMFKVNHPEYERITRTQTRNDCMSVYELEKKKLKTYFERVKKISLTTDVWKSDSQKRSYLCVTGHFLEQDWKLQKRVLTFVNFPPPHGGDEIAKCLMKCIDDWSLQGKVFTISVDNASPNDKAMRIMKTTFSTTHLPLGGKLFHVKCCAHILNLVVQDGLAEIKTIIQKVKESVAFLNKSESRILLFSSIVKQMNLGTKKLIYDCSTRWNSTYEMLQSALEVKNAFPAYAIRESEYVHCPTEEEWKKVEQVIPLLKVFYDATHVISGSDYPTSNQFYTLIWKVREVINKSIDHDDYFVSSMGKKMKDKFDKYWGDCHLLLSIANVLDPRCKLHMLRFSFEKIYGKETSATHLGLVRTSLQELYNDYKQLESSTTRRGSNHVSNTSTQELRQGASSSTSEIDFMLSAWGSYGEYLESTENDESGFVRSDLDIYLEEGVHRCKDNISINFDALEWWKVNESKYPILSKMARDILAIPITTVASEATFSVSGRILDPYCAALLPETVQALVCGGDWLRCRHGLKLVEDEKPVIIDLIEDEVQERI